MRMLAFLYGKRKVSGPNAGHGFTYIETPQFYSSDTRRLALIRPYEVPEVSVYGNDRNGWQHRRIGGPQPALATIGQGIILNDPRGKAGNGPVPTTPGGSPLISSGQINAANNAPGSAGAYNSANVKGTDVVALALAAQNAAYAAANSSAQTNQPGSVSNANTPPVAASPASTGGNRGGGFRGFGGSGPSNITNNVHDVSHADFHIPTRGPQ